MLDQEHPLSRLIEELKKIPSIGAKTAQRIAFYLIGIPKDEVNRLKNVYTVFDLEYDTELREALETLQKGM